MVDKAEGLKPGWPPPGQKWAQAEEKGGIQNCHQGADWMLCFCLSGGRWNLKSAFSGLRDSWNPL